MTEEWRSIDGWPGYEVSSFGRVRSWKKRGIDPSLLREPNVLRTSMNRDGYLDISLYDGVRKKYVRHSIHRLVALVFHGLPPTKTHHAAHRDGNRCNNRMDNLRWATPAENCADQITHGTTLWGEKHRCARLKVQDVLAIRASRESAKVLAERYGVSKSGIKHVRSGRSWTHL